MTMLAAEHRERWRRHLGQKLNPDRCDPEHPGGLYLLLERERGLTCVAVKPEESSAA